MTRRRRGSKRQITFAEQQGKTNPLFLNYLQSSGFMRPSRRHTPPGRWWRRTMTCISILVLIGVVYIIWESIRGASLF